MYQQKPCGSCRSVHWSEITSVWHMVWWLLGCVIVCPNITKATYFVTAPSRLTASILIPIMHCANFRWQPFPAAPKRFVTPVKEVCQSGHFYLYELTYSNLISFMSSATFVENFLLPFLLPPTGSSSDVLLTRETDINEHNIFES